MIQLLDDLSFPTHRLESSSSQSISWKGETMNLVSESSTFILSYEYARPVICQSEAYFDEVRIHFLCSGCYFRCLSFCSQFNRTQHERQRTWRLDFFLMLSSFFKKFVQFGDPCFIIDLVIFNYDLELNRKYDFNKKISEFK